MGGGGDGISHQSHQQVSSNHRGSRGSPNNSGNGEQEVQTLTFHNWRRGAHSQFPRKLSAILGLDLGPKHPWPPSLTWRKLAPLFPVFWHPLWSMDIADTVNALIPFPSSPPEFACNCEDNCPHLQHPVSLLCLAGLSESPMTFSEVNA